MDVAEVVNNVRITSAILIANIEAHRTVCTVKGREVESGYVHLLLLLYRLRLYVESKPLFRHEPVKQLLILSTELQQDIIKTV